MAELEIVTVVYS